MGDLLKGIFGGQESDPDYWSQARDFINRYEEGEPWANFSGQEAMQRYRQVAGQLPPDEFERAAEEAFARMSPQQRTRFAEMLHQAIGGQAAAAPDAQMDDPRLLASTAMRLQQRDPDGLAGLFGGGGAGTVLGAAIGAMGGNPAARGGLGELLDDPLAKAVLGGIAAMAMKRTMSR